ncbi:MAG: DnaJ domain-containing protein [Deltaproteobacteria bacterium]|nr:DnaJ domain-containing protein [Deltaproteobacteria bacterium]
MKDYYQILGISRGAAEADIKKAYRRLARQYHPDMNKGEKKAEERFKEISEAYSVLSDSEKRKQYDAFGSAPFGGGFRYYTSADESGGEEGFPGGAGDLGDIFSELFNIGGVKRKPKWGFTGGESRESRKGGDIYADLEIDFLEAVYGLDTRLAIKRGDRTEKITVKIPAGVDNGSKVRVSGKGHPGARGGEDGDLYINIKVKPHPIFWREGADIYTEVPISVYEAVLGATIEVPTRPKIPPEGKRCAVSWKKGDRRSVCYSADCSAEKNKRQSKRIF